MWIFLWLANIETKNFVIIELIFCTKSRHQPIISGVWVAGHKKNVGRTKIAIFRLQYLSYLLTHFILNRWRWCEITFRITIYWLGNRPENYSRAHNFLQNKQPGKNIGIWILMKNFSVVHTMKKISMRQSPSTNRILDITLLLVVTNVYFINPLGNQTENGRH